MVSNIKNTDFFRKSKFQENFILDQNLDLYEKMVSRYEEHTKDEPGEYRIPFIIHQIWMGSPLPSKYKKWSEDFQRLNPKFEYVLWDENSILSLDFSKRDLFKAANNWAVKSDIARLAILKKYGGVYLDTDFEPVNPFPLSMFRERFVACLDFNTEYKPSINNAMFASEKNGKVISDIYNKIYLPENDRDPNLIFYATGPHLFSRVMQECLRESPEEILVLPSNYFYTIPSFESGQLSRRESPSAESEVIAIHHWDISWIPLRLKIYSAIKRVARSVIRFFGKTEC